jgi:hypothetical protein
MPQAAAAISTFFYTAGTAIGLSAATSATFAVAATNALAYATNSFLISKAIAALQKRGNTGESRGMEVAITDSTAESRVIYGEIRISGVNIIPPYTSGTEGNILHQVLAISMREIDSFQKYYFEQEELPTPTSVSGNANDGKITSGTFKDAAWVRGYTGSMSQNVDYILNAAFPTNWPSTARGRGTAYVALAYDYGKGKVFRGVPQATFKVRGAKVYDPRLDSTNGGSGSHRYATPSTWAYSNNPALCWADYRIGAYGFGLDPATEIDWASVITAADICDALVANKAGGTRKRYTFNGLITNALDGLRDNNRLLIDAMFGRETFVNGKFACFAGAWTVPSYTIQKKDWLSIDSIQTVGGRDAGRFNEVHCFYVDPARNWQRVECYPRRNLTYKSADYAEAIGIEMEQPACTDESEAQMKAEFLLRSSRNGIKLSGMLPPRFHKIKTFDTVALNFEELGWTSKTFRVSAMVLNMDGSVSVALTEEQEADWTDLTSGEYGTISAATIPTTNPTKPSAVTSLTATSFPGTIEFNWDDPVVRPENTTFRLMQASANSYGGAAERWTGSVNRALIGMPNTATYYHWLDSVGQNGSYSTFPAVNSGIVAGALLVDTNNVAPQSVTKTYTNYVSVVNTPSYDLLHAVVNSVDVGGTFEMTLTGRVQCLSLGTADYLGAKIQVSGGGSLTPSAGLLEYRITTSGQVVTVNHAATFVSTGSGPWTVEGGFLDMGGGSAFKAFDVTLRTTAIRR